MPIVEVPGLGTAEFPDDMPREKIEAVIKQTLDERRASLQSDIDEYQTPASAGERYAEGMQRMVAGAGQFFSRPLAGAATLAERVTGDTAVTDYLQDLPRQNDQIANDQLHDQQTATNGLDGFDFAGLAGEMTALSPTVAAAAPASLAGLVGSGAALGGMSGAATPTQGGEGFAQRKAAQIGAGTVAGAVAAPVAKGAMHLLGRAIGATVTQLRKLGPQASPQQVQVTINQTLQNAGVDPARVPPQYMNEITSQVQRALRAGGPVDDSTLANRAAFESVGVQGTKGQITQDPAQYGKELFLRESPGGEELAAQYKNSLQALNQSVGELQEGAAPPINRVEAGREVMGVLKEADERGRGLVGDLYRQASKSAGQDVQINGAKFADKVFKEIEDDVSAPLPAGSAAALNRLASGGLELNVNSAQRLLKAVNREYGKADDATRYSLDILKRNLDEALESISDSSGKEASIAYKTARKAAAQRFAIQEAVPALRDTVNGKASPDDFLKKYVYGAKVDDLKALSTFVKQASPKTWQQVRGQVLSDIQKAANPSGDPADFSQHAFNKMLRTLDQSEKLDVIFSKSEINTLRNIGKVGRMVQAGPPGVSRTGLSGAAKAGAALARFAGNVPLLGRFGAIASSAAQKGGNIMQANAALRPQPVAQVPLRNAIPAQSANRLAPFAGSASFLPLTEKADQ